MTMHCLRTRCEGENKNPQYAKPTFMRFILPCRPRF